MEIEKSKFDKSFDKYWKSLPLFIRFFKFIDIKSVCKLSYVVGVYDSDEIIEKMANSPSPPRG